MNKTILIGLILLALSIVFHALAARYDVIAVSDEDVSAIYRLDRLTGRLWICANDQCLRVQDVDKKQAGQRTSL